MMTPMLTCFAPTAVTAMSCFSPATSCAVPRVPAGDTSVNSALTLTSWNPEPGATAFGSERSVCEPMLMPESEAARGVKILARSLYRQMRAEGYTNPQMVLFVDELLAQLIAGNKGGN